MSWFNICKNYLVILTILNQIQTKKFDLYAIPTPPSAPKGVDIQFKRQNLPSRGRIYSKEAMNLKCLYNASFFLKKQFKNLRYVLATLLPKVFLLYFV